MTDQPLDVVRRVYAALAAGDVATMVALTDPEVTIVQSDALPYGGRFHGHDGLKRFATGVATTLDSRVEIHELFAAGTTVVQTGRTRGTARATGAAFDSPEVHVWEVRDGRVLSLHAYVDDAVVLAATRQST